ncbi:MAG TPA: ABC transporter permease [Actinomycetota bacterium]|nr:ABC transporter permease [Actinomycetota bacterium]
MRGADYVLKRAAFALITVFAAITLNFVMFRALPGDAVTNLSRVPKATPELKHALLIQFGLDKPKWEQYLIYLKQLTHANLGVSFDNSQPVLKNLKTDLANTIPMVTLGTVFSIVFGILTGILSAWRRGTLLDQVSTNTAVAFYSMPTQWLALMLIILMATRYHFPTQGISDPFLLNPTPWAHIKDVLRHMFLPSLTLGLTLYGEYTLVVRSAMLETLGEDYILTARAKGLPPSQIVRKHALRNAMLPIATLIALSLGYIVAGTVLIEYVFSWPGIGRAVVEAVHNRDYPMLQGAFLILTVSVVFFNFVADLLYFKLDPRVTE